MPARKSSALHKALGTARGHNQHITHAEALVKPPPCPPGLSNPEKLTWKRLARAAVDAGTLARGDHDALLLATRAVTRAQRLSAEAADVPPTTTGASGQLVGHPAHKTAADAVKLALQTLAALGLTPQARGGINALPGSGLDDRVREEERKAAALIDGGGPGRSTSAETN